MADILSELASNRRAGTIAEVVDIMTTIDRELPEGDGIRWFNRLYLQVTRSVRSVVGTSTFRDPAFLERLDVVFANLYFDALANGARNPRDAPAAWRPMFECRSRRGILSIQFALAGMNAHINRDLPEGIVSAFLATGGAPMRSGPRYDDFCRVNDLLEEVESQIKVEFSTGIVAVVDAAGGQVDDVVAMWKVRAARETAWTNAEVLWALRAMPLLRESFFSRLDSFTGFAGRGLLIPARPHVNRDV